MTEKDKRLAYKIYLYLGALFITSLVVSNLIFQKFFYWKPFGPTTVLNAPLFEISVGVLPYPITFLITDLISEVYGKRKANQVVTAGIFASLFSMSIILVAEAAPAIPASPIDDKVFRSVFALSPVAVLASMVAYLCAQYVDIAIYHFWKKVTRGKYLWIRNNCSTFTSQFIDTFLVVSLMCIFGVIPWKLFYGLVISGFLFKIFIAICDTPFLYFFVYIFRRRFKIQTNEELLLEF